MQCGGRCGTRKNDEKKKRIAPCPFTVSSRQVLLWYPKFFPTSAMGLLVLSPSPNGRPLERHDPANFMQIADFYELVPPDLPRAIGPVHLPMGRQHIAAARGISGGAALRPAIAAGGNAGHAGVFVWHQFRAALRAQPLLQSGTSLGV